MDRGSEPWMTNAAGPLLTIGDVSVTALGEQRSRVVSPDGEREVERFERARRLADELAGDAA